MELIVQTIIVDYQLSNNSLGTLNRRFDSLRTQDE